MENEKNIVDILLDENDNSNVFISDDKGHEVEFEQVALIPLDDDPDNIYVILHPVTKIQGVEDDEALVFVIKEDGDDDIVELVKDFDIINKVFDEYRKLVEQSEN